MGKDLQNWKWEQTDDSRSEVGKLWPGELFNLARRAFTTVFFLPKTRKVVSSIG